MKDTLKRFLDNYDGFKLNEGKTRVICEITGHELPCSVPAIEAYMNGKKYKQLTNNGACRLSSLAEYKDYLIPSKKNKNMLYCLVTRKEINNIPSHIQNHVMGRKFQRDLKIYKASSGPSEKQHTSDDKPSTQNDSKKGEASTAELDDEMLEEKEDIMEEEGEELRLKQEDVGFQGGIWYPDVMECEANHVDDIKMDVENPNKKAKMPSKGAKNQLKRKIKDSKKGKSPMAVNKKKKR